jgi:hypothetical protein
MNQLLSIDSFIITSEVKLWTNILAKIDKLLTALSQRRIEHEFSIEFDFSAPRNIHFTLITNEPEATNIKVLYDKYLFQPLNNVSIKRVALPMHKPDKIQFALRSSLSRLMITAYKSDVVDVEDLLTLVLQCYLALIYVLKKRKIEIKQELDAIYQALFPGYDFPEIDSVFTANLELILEIKRSIFSGGDLNSPSWILKWIHELDTIIEKSPDDLMTFYKQIVYLINKHFGLNQYMSIALTYLVKKVISEEAEAY